MKKIIILLGINAFYGFFVSPVWAQGGINTYQDCLVYATRQGLARTQEEAKQIEKNCRRRFADTAPPLQQISKPLNKKALGHLDIWNNSNSEIKPGASIYNNNRDITITQLNILATPSGKDSIQTFFDSEEYEMNLEIPPYKTISIDLPAGSKLKGDLRWKILRGQGY